METNDFSHSLFKLYYCSLDQNYVFGYFVAFSFVVTIMESYLELCDRTSIEVGSVSLLTRCI